MLDHPYQYVLELWHKTPGILLGRVPIDVDWVPVREALILDLLRRGIIEQPGELPPIKVEPIWEERAGPPLIMGFRATLTAGGVESSRIFSVTFFSGEAQQAASGFVEAGTLKKGELFEYDVLAIPRQPVRQSPPRFSFAQSEIPLPIKPASLERVMNSALLFGIENGDLPVFFRWSVLEEASILTRKAGCMETGGVLIGNICRDASVPDLFLEITALIPAKAKGELTRLCFTPDTWSNVQAEVDRRSHGEVWLGWFHSHSFDRDPTISPKARESDSQRIATPFLSDEDRRLHRVCFPRAYGIALLVTDSIHSGMSWTTFGWRSGTLARRAYHVIHAPLPKAFQISGDNNEANREHIAQ